MFKLEIDTANSAFDGYEGHEIARILRELAAGLEHSSVPRLPS